MSSLATIYIKLIRVINTVLVIASIILLMTMPIALAHYSDQLPRWFMRVMYDLALWTVFIVMAIRPLADLLPKLTFLRPLILLRKGLGIVSSAIIVSIVLSKVMIGGVSYMAGYFEPSFWSFENYTFFAHLGDVTGFILLTTSNEFSQRVLKKNWKRIQRLAYAYFYAGALYVFLAIGKDIALYFMIVVTVLVTLAYAKKRIKMAHVAAQAL